MKKPSKKSARKFAAEVCASIEKHQFSMDFFKKGSGRTLPTCGTAQCKAGHIIAMRPRRAKELMASDPVVYTIRDCPNYDNLALTIWEEETGAAYGGDFFDMNQTKEEALSELRRLVK
jgi:hypothetical protein